VELKFIQKVSDSCEDLTVNRTTPMKEKPTYLSADGSLALDVTDEKWWESAADGVRTA
jgi:hypothetical protein